MWIQRCSQNPRSGVTRDWHQQFMGVGDYDGRAEWDEVDDGRPWHIPDTGLCVSDGIM